MDRTERFYKIHHLLNGSSAVSMLGLMQELGVSRATIKRDLEYMRERLFAPIVWELDLGGYRLDMSLPGAHQYSLPGLWFSDQEIHALLTMQRLLSNIGNGLLEPHVKPLLARLEKLLDSKAGSSAEIARRIRILHMANRTERPEHFEAVASATIKRQQLQIIYHARSSAEVSQRIISPQRLVHYRDNWYLDAWCHWREGLRSFSLDCIAEVVLLPHKAKAIADKVLDEELASGYGIFSGKPDQLAVLRFSKERARWVAAEQWHPQQVGRYDADGSYVLELPYRADEELLMDILKYGPDVEVLAPLALRQRVLDRLRSTLSNYS